MRQLNFFLRTSHFNQRKQPQFLIRFMAPSITLAPPRTDAHYKHTLGRRRMQNEWHQQSPKPIHDPLDRPSPRPSTTLTNQIREP
uniref:Uncharacterized protein n=1 Tax=Arundo donax TaxID=35708 RepID=A0A0A9FDD3_ARUDO